jgi:hypothetical protein
VQPLEEREEVLVRRNVLCRIFVGLLTSLKTAGGTGGNFGGGSAGGGTGGGAGMCMESAKRVDRIVNVCNSWWQCRYRWWRFSRRRKWLWSYWIERRLGKASLTLESSGLVKLTHSQ